MYTTEADLQGHADRTELLCDDLGDGKDKNRRAHGGCPRCVAEAQESCRSELPRPGRVGAEQLPPPQQYPTRRRSVQALREGTEAPFQTSCA